MDDEQQALEDAHRELNARRAGFTPKKAVTSTPRKSAASDQDSDSTRFVDRIDLGIVYI